MAVSSPSRCVKITKDLFALADIAIGGDKQFDLQVHNASFYDDVIVRGSMGLGESYMRGWWDCEALDQFFYRILGARLDEKVRFNTRLLLQIIQQKLFNLQSKRRSFIVGEQHYDLGNDLYQCMLDSRLVYTCGYWKDANNLEEAQANKLKLTCEKLQLSPGMRVLDIGCGWGSFAKYAAENYGVEVVGVTISREQRDLAQALCEGLPVDIRLQDYRDLDESFDRIVSLGMFEHVGLKNYATYMQVANRCLKDQGLFLLHTIGNNKACATVDPWINKYIFPNGKLPTIAEIAKTSEPYFIMEDWHNFGPDYDKTLMAWHDNFQAGWSQLSDQYDNTFRRMWSYYLLSCAGSFRARSIQLWQIMFSKGAVVGGIPSIR